MQESALTALRWPAPGRWEVQMTSSKQALIVDDDEALRVSLAEQLELHEGFVTYQAEDGAQALDLVKQHHFEFILMDVGLPDIDGRDLCRLMRRQGIKTPIIMLTAHDSDADTILGLDSGANDYIPKPFRLGVLLARLRAQLRQFELSDDATFPIGPYTFRPSVKMLISPETNRRIHLTEKETAILKYLYRMGDRPVSARSCWTRSGATTPGSPRTPWRRTSTVCARRSSRSRPMRSSW